MRGKDISKMPVESIKDVNENTFVPEVIEKSKEKIVIVDFWAPWCGPCKALTPILESQATKKKEHLEVVKVNVCLLYTSPSPRD